MVSAHPADSGGGGVPPLLVQQECLDDQIERRLLPCRIGEPTVLGQRFDRGGCSRIVEASSDIIGQAPIFSRGLGPQLQLLAGGAAEENGRASFRERGGRYGSSKGVDVAIK